MTIAGRAGLSPFGTGQAGNRAALGSLLGEMVGRYATVGAMPSSLVIYLDDNDAGPGFYARDQSMAVLPPRASRGDKELIWVSDVKKVFDHLGGA